VKRLLTSFFICKARNIFYGQCSEMFGANHGSMPICRREDFVQMSRFLLEMVLDINLCSFCTIFRPTLASIFHFL
jgi:hypothetical protein